MIKVPYEVIEFRELKALKAEYSWKSVFAYWFCMKTAATIFGMGLCFYIYGFAPSWERSAGFYKYEIIEALLWIPMMLVCSIAEYGKVVLRVHRRMGVICKGREYFKVK